MNKHIYEIVTIGILLIVFGCRSLVRQTVTYDSKKQLGNTDEVMVFNFGQSVPDSCKLLGKMKIGGVVDTVCGYEQLIDEAKKQARRIGGNIINITEFVKPDGPFDGCNAITVNIYFHEHIDDLVRAQNLVQDSITKSKFSGGPTFAILYVYRPGNLLGAAIGYDIFLNDSIICKAKNNSKYEIQVYKEGKMEISAKRKSKQTKTFDVKPGEEYFFKCEVIPDLKRMGTKPDINLIDKTRGRSEYAAVKERD